MALTSSLTEIEPLPLGNFCIESKGLDHWTTSNALNLWDRGKSLFHQLHNVLKCDFKFLNARYIVHTVSLTRQSSRVIVASQFASHVIFF